LKASRSFKSVAKICGEHGEWAERTRWFEEMRLVLLQEGFAGINARLKILQLDKGRFREKQRKAVWKLRKYFWKHRGRMNYSERLSQGRSIGSGQREGACKNLVGKRLKQTGVCWKVDRVNRIAVITAALYSDKWKLCWNTAKYLQMFYTPVDNQNEMWYFYLYDFNKIYRLLFRSCCFVFLRKRSGTGFRTKTDIEQPNPRCRNR
jgi:hypothetical protein